MRATRSERLASETSEESAARLQQMSARLHERLAFETAEERTARLQQMSASQHLIETGLWNCRREDGQAVTHEC